MNDEKKVVHVSMYGGGHFAPCGARTSVHAATFDPEKGFTYNPAREAESKDMQSSATDIERVTCPECQRATRELSQKYQRARRKKVVTW